MFRIKCNLVAQVNGLEPFSSSKLVLMDQRLNWQVATELIPHNKLLQSDKIMASCLLQNTQKPRHHAFAAEEGRYAAQTKSQRSRRELK